MKLPRADTVEVDVRKVADYLLSSTHPVGRHKARYFIALGFSDTSTAAFIGEIRRIAATEDVASVKDRRQHPQPTAAFASSALATTRCIGAALDDRALSEGVADLTRVAAMGA